MPNRNLTPDELVKAGALLNEIRTRLHALSAGDSAALFAYRRKIAKELQYDERGGPNERRLLKAQVRERQGGKCAVCPHPLPEKYAVLDRLEAMGGYTLENTRLLCVDCDTRIQRERGYR